MTALHKGLFYEFLFSSSKFESLERETISKFLQKGEKFDDYMDEVALLHTDINRTLQRCNIPVSIYCCEIISTNYASLPHSWMKLVNIKYTTNN